MTAEDYILANCQHLPMAVHLDIAKAFQAGRRDVALNASLIQGDSDYETLTCVGNFINYILDETDPHKTKQEPQ